ncbi:hypothetical protein FNT36_23615 [Hymenobacter setariae]|uniref:Uncharacterized protein n=1 Tax=Hymenobacter setariae TaxID=2594794 RepID=A0A558BLK6_9BACT|nr:hypothetical protein [Hymenobacter setariae]TVT37388.1 hypothetical protein FNT36_23615 [Hymenobacter setariae]
MVKYLIVFVALSNLFGCVQGKEDRAFEVFNEGVILSLDAVKKDQNGQHDKAIALNRQAIDKFKETLIIDSTHFGARGALGHSYYLLGDFKEAINWFEKSNVIDDKSAGNSRELGLSRINLGQIEAGYKDLTKAFKLDKSEEIRSITADDLYDIGKLAFEYSAEYSKRGEAKKGANYQEFSLTVLKMAYDIDENRKDIAATLVEFADKAGEKELADKYR